MIRAVSFAIAVALTVLTVAEVRLSASEVDYRAVRIGIDGPQFDACGSVGQPTGLSSAGDHYLSVRTAPSVKAAEVDRLKPKQTFNLCDSSKDGKWIGIVYAPPLAAEIDCGTGSPVETVRGYVGPCRTGWISTRFVNVIAG